MKSIKVFAVLVLALSLTVIGHPAEASFLEDTAGISASATISPVDLTVAQTAFKNIERQDSTYIVGSVALDGYDEDHDVHVYITSAGHIIAYYLNNEPASKIVDWVGYRGGAMTLDGSNLEDALTKVCTVTGDTLPTVTYYDFRYPTANNIKIIADEEFVTSATDTFTYTIPSSITILEGSYSFAISVTSGSSYDPYFQIDGNTIQTFINPSVGWDIRNAEISSSYLSADVQHEVLIYNARDYMNSFAAVVFVYSE